MIASSLASMVDVVNQIPSFKPWPVPKDAALFARRTAGYMEQTCPAARHLAHRILARRSVVPRGALSVMRLFLLGQTPPASATPVRQWPAITLESLLYLVILALALLSRFWD